MRISLGKNIYTRLLLPPSLPWKAALQVRGFKAPPSLASRQICFWLQVYLLSSFHSQERIQFLPCFLYWSSFDHLLKHSVSPSETQTSRFQNINIMQLYLATQRMTRNAVDYIIDKIWFVFATLAYISYEIE